MDLCGIDLILKGLAVSCLWESIQAPYDYMDPLGNVNVRKAMK